MNDKEKKGTFLGLLKAIFRFRWLRFNLAGIIVLILALLIPIAITAFITIYLPVKQIHKEAVDSSDTLFTDRSDLPKENLASLNHLYNLQKDEAFLKAKQKYLNSDSVIMILDLVDSIISLEIRGVSVLESPIMEMEITKAFKKLDASEILALMQVPLTLEGRNGTIDAVPIVVKEAPKDTAEANSETVEYLNPKMEDVYVTMDFSRDFLIYLEQFEPPTPEDISANIEYQEYIRNEQYQLSLAALKSFRAPVHPMWLRIKIHREDARSVFRALPENGKMIVRL